MKNKKKIKIILIPLIILVLLIGSFIVSYYIDDHNFYSNLKKYDEDYLLKVTYLVVDKDRVPSDITIDKTFKDHIDDKLFSFTETVPLEKKND